MSRYEELEAFMRTVEAGSFTGAAKQLRVAKSAISRRIQELETRLGAQLLIRSTRKLSLTEAGQALYGRSVILLADWEEAENSVREDSAVLFGHIRLAAPLSFGVTHLGPALLDFTEAHPGISLDVDFSDRKVDLIAEGIDVAIRIGDLPDSSLIARKLADIKLVAVASPDYISAHGQTRTPDDLKSMTELRYGHRDKVSWIYKDPAGKTGSLDMRSTIRASNGEFLRDAAIAGQGVAILPSFIVYKAIESGELVKLLGDYTWPQLGAYAVYSASRNRSERVKALVAHLAEHCGGTTPYWDV